MCSCAAEWGDSGGPLPQPFFVFAVALSAPPCAPLLFFRPCCLVSNRELEERNERHSAAWASCVKRHPNATLPPPNSRNQSIPGAVKKNQDPLSRKQTQTTSSHQTQSFQSCRFIPLPFFFSTVERVQTEHSC